MELPSSSEKVVRMTQLDTRTRAQPFMGTLDINGKPAGVTVNEHDPARVIGRLPFEVISFAPERETQTIIKDQITDMRRNRWCYA